jgi:mannan endo-1,6-alpha-mannosidase
MNQTYVEWAEKAWEWSTTVPLVIESEWKVNDLVDARAQCKDPSGDQWSYNYGIYFAGAAYMYNLYEGRPYFGLRRYAGKFFT